jgi:hypothetical protein
MTAEQGLKYKVRYDYRVRKPNGEYIRILHQMLTIIPDENGMSVHVFCVHTDITYLKPSGIETHRKNMLTKTEMSTTPELIAKAINSGWI